MTRMISSRLLLLATLLVCFTLSGLIAGPILKRPRLFDELRAFADISRVQIEIDPLPKALAEVDLYPATIRERIVASLNEDDIRITDDTSAPKLHVKSVTMSSEEYPDAVGYLLVVDLVQMTRIVRLDEQLLLPTATISLYAIKPKADVARAYLDTVDDALKRVRTAIRWSSDERSRRDGEIGG